MSKFRPGVRVTKDKTAEVFAAIELFGKRHVVVGIPEANDQRDQDEDGYVNPIGNAALYYVHDQGSALANVPQRETLRPGVADASEDVAEVLGQAAAAAFEDSSALERGLEAAGLIAETAVRKRIVASVDLQPLAESTLAERRRKGIASIKPLIREGDMLRAITHEVRDVK